MSRVDGGSSFVVWSDRKRPALPRLQRFSSTINCALMCTRSAQVLTPGKEKAIAPSSEDFSKIKSQVCLIPRVGLIGDGRSSLKAKTGKQKCRASKE